jgi:hypothetical protein
MSELSISGKLSLEAVLPAKQVVAIVKSAGKTFRDT